MVALGEKAARELVARAEAACFFTGVGDLAERLCAANMRYGLAKIRYVQKQLGCTPDASFVGAPDATITRNVERWQAGFGYGGRIRHSGEFTVLDIKSNCCGLYFGLLDERPDKGELLDRVLTVKREDAWCEDKPDRWDFGKSNHFISVVHLSPGMDGREYGVLCHGSGPELRAPGSHGPGLYLSDSPRLQELARRFETPWGQLNVLPAGEATQEYWAGFQAAEAASKARRVALASSIFPEIREVSNHTHQGALAPNDIYLGCVAEPGVLPVPITLRADLPVWFFRLEPNISDDVAAGLGVLERAEGQNLGASLRNVNLLPHGGGYTVPGYASIASVLETHGTRVYEMAIDVGGKALAYQTNFRHVPFGYRGEAVVRRVEELRMGTAITRGIPLFSFMV